MSNFTLSLVCFLCFSVQYPSDLLIAWVAVMAMAVSRDATLALTVSADHLIGRYDLMVVRN